MYGDGSSPYSGLGRDLHRIAPSVHEFVQRSTTAMWGAKHDTWNPRGVLQEAMEADGKAFEKRTVDMFRSACYHAVCFTYVTRELMHVQPTHAFGLSLGEAATYFAFDEANSKQSDAVLARRASSHPPSPSPHTVLHPSHLSHPSHPSRPCALSFVPSPPLLPPPAHTRTHPHTPAPLPSPGEPRCLARVDRGARLHRRQRRGLLGAAQGLGRARRRAGGQLLGGLRGAGVARAGRGGDQAARHGSQLRAAAHCQRHPHVHRRGQARAVQGPRGAPRLRCDAHRAGHGRPLQRGRTLP